MAVLSLLLASGWHWEHTSSHLPTRAVVLLIYMSTDVVPCDQWRNEGGHGAGPPRQFRFFLRKGGLFFFFFSSGGNIFYVGVKKKINSVPAPGNKESRYATACGNTG